MGQIWKDNTKVVGDGDDNGRDDNGRDDGDVGGGRVFPEHPSSILLAPRDKIYSKGKSLTPISI